MPAGVMVVNHGHLHVVSCCVVLLLCAARRSMNADIAMKNCALVRLMNFTLSELLFV